MTVRAIISKKNRLLAYIPTVFCLSLAIIMIIFGKSLRSGIYTGLLFSLQTIIPTLFPFFILSDLWSATFHIKDDGIASKIFERLFRINGIALSAFLSGMICGFPIGVKTANELYQHKKISKAEFEHLCCFANNPSIAFVISGVGAGILSNIKFGILLYLAIILSAFTVGIAFRPAERICKDFSYISEQKFNLVNSIKNAAVTSLNVIAYIIFFSGLIGLLSSFLQKRTTIAMISAFLEISNAVKLLSELSAQNQVARLVLIAFALGFSGLSVHMQAFAFLPHEFSRRKYLLIKLAQGCFSMIYMFLLSFF